MTRVRARARVCACVRAVIDIHADLAVTNTHRAPSRKQTNRRRVSSLRDVSLHFIRGGTNAHAGETRGIVCTSDVPESMRALRALPSLKRLRRDFRRTLSPLKPTFADSLDMRCTGAHRRVQLLYILYSRGLYCALPC